MHNRRLLRLAALLEADAKKKKGIKFDLRTFGEVKNPNKPLSCGTAACALGLAALSGAFKHQGLRYTITDHGDIDIVFYRNGAYWCDFDAGAELFDIDDTTARWLFHPQYYLGEKVGADSELAVAKRIRSFVAGKKTPWPLAI